jgi:hypothetical protein
VPKNLLEQFRRYQNFYFLLVCIPTLIPSVSPISPASAILPFLAILLVAAVKEGWEDWVWLLLFLPLTSLETVETRFGVQQQKI